MRALNLKTSKTTVKFFFSYKFTMDFDLFDIEIALKLTTMILKGNYTCSRSINEKLHLCTSHLRYFAKHACNFFINTSRTV